MKPKKSIEILSFKIEDDLVFAETTSRSRNLRHVVFINLTTNDCSCDCEHMGFGRTTECSHILTVKNRLSLLPQGVVVSQTTQTPPVNI